MRVATRRGSGVDVGKVDKRNKARGKPNLAIEGAMWSWGEKQAVKRASVGLEATVLC